MDSNAIDHGGDDNAAAHDVVEDNTTSSDLTDNDVKEGSVAEPKQRLCFTCGKSATKYCATCKNARYCSSECQKSGWETHKLLCKSFIQLEPRPGLNYFRGILLPANENLPRFVWNEYSNGDVYYTIQARNHTNGELMAGHLQFDRYRPLKRMLGYTIGIYHKDLFVHLPPTPVLSRCLGPELAYRWRGPFLAHGYEDGEIDEDGMEAEDRKPRDLDTSDLAPILDFFKFRSQYPMLSYDLDLEANVDHEVRMMNAIFG